MAEEGANVVIDYVAEREATEELEKQVAALGEPGHRRRRRRQQGRTTCRRSSTRRKHFGRLDIMVNNAGIETRTSILDTTEEQYEKVLDINLKSAFFGTQLAAKQMIAQGSGGRDHQHDLGPRGLAHAGQHALLPVKGRDADADPTAGVELAPARHSGRRCRDRVR